MGAQAKPSVSEVERAFADELQRNGYLPGSIEFDTKNFVRFDAPGDKTGKRNGFYKIKSGDYPVAWFGDWKEGVQHEWFYKDPDRPPLTNAEREKIKREQRRLKIEAEVARETRQAEVAEDASLRWGKGTTDGVESHPYVVAKAMEHPRGVRIHIASDGTRLLLVPMWSFDIEGKPKLTNLQHIGPDGSKRFMSSGRVSGTFFSLSGDTSTVVVCEGYATGQAIWEATGLSVVCAFNAGNLIEVVKELARFKPLARLLIAGDDDEIAPADWADRGNGRPWVNQGVKKAQAAAKAVGCRWIKPYFREGPSRGRQDFDDLRREEGKEAVTRQVLGAFQAVDPVDSEPGATIVQIDVVQDESWRSQIPTTSNGHPDGANVHGVALYIANHKLLKGRVGFNSFTKEIELDGNPLEDWNVSQFRKIMHADGFKAKKPDVYDEMESAARAVAFDPLQDYLFGLKWDGLPRVDGWMNTYLGAADDRYTEVVGRKALVGAVARALDPGRKLDTMIVLEGPQGTGKSTAIRYLFGDRFFTDHLPDFHSKDAFMQLQGVWAIEVGELATMAKSEVTDVKLFLSRLVDKFRPPYGRATVTVPRRTVFWGTVNPEDGNGYLKDQTGARRFWPVTTTTIDTSGLLRDRDQLWAEAVAAFRDGETWYLDQDDEKLAKFEQEKRREADPWEPLVQSWLIEKQEVTCTDVLIGAMRMLPAAITVKESRRAGSCLRALGWESRPGRQEGEVVKIFTRCT